MLPQGQKGGKWKEEEMKNSTTKKEKVTYHESYEHLLDTHRVGNISKGQNKDLSCNNLGNMASMQVGESIWDKDKRERGIGGTQAVIV